MDVLLTCKNEADLIKNKGARVLTRLNINFSETQGQLTPQSVMESSRNSNSSKLLWLPLLAALKNEEDPIKNEGARVLTTFLPL